MSEQADLRRRVLGWRAAERREHALRAREERLDPDTSLAAADEMRQLLPSAAEALDTIRAREIVRARAAWRKLRVRLAPTPASPRKR